MTTTQPSDATCTRIHSEAWASVGIAMQARAFVLLCRNQTYSVCHRAAGAATNIRDHLYSQTAIGRLRGIQSP
jgi:hypothetical protein